MLDNTRFSTPVGPLVLSRSIALDYRNAEQDQHWATLLDQPDC
ncbi:MAG: hypothetical protein ACLR9W_03050 [Enterobacter hormaechei]